MPVEPTAPAVRRLLRKLGEAGFRDLLALKRADNLAQNPAYQDRLKTYDALEALAEQILAENQAFRLKDLAINGEDLLALGMVPGPEMGALLNRLLDEVVSDCLPNEREALLAAARKMIC